MDNKRKECEMLWAKNKYYVLSKSQKAYLEIREYLKRQDIDINIIHEQISAVREYPESKKDFYNAILHIWGYFKKYAKSFEKRELFEILDDYMNSNINQDEVIKYIQNLLLKYPNKYLQESNLITGEFNETLA